MTYHITFYLLVILTSTFHHVESSEVIFHEDFTKGNVVCHLTYKVENLSSSKSPYISVKRAYSEQCHDEIIVRPLQEGDVSEYATLVEQSQVHMSKFDDHFWGSNGGKKDGKVDKEYIRNHLLKDSEKMGVFYIHNPNPNTPIVIGQTGFNGITNKEYGNEVFNWRGSNEYIQDKLEDVNLCKGAMHAARVGFLAFKFLQNPELKSVCSFTYPDNEREQALSKSIGFEDTGKEVIEYGHTYLIFKMTREEFNKKYLSKTKSASYHQQEKKESEDKTTPTLLITCCIGFFLLCIFYYYFQEIEIEATSNEEKPQNKAEEDDEESDDTQDEAPCERHVDTQSNKGKEDKT